MIRERGGFDFGSFVKCDLCGLKHGTQMHERIKRSQTIKGSEARELSFQPELCNLLCPECHEKADTIEIDELLWKFSIQLYGIIAVRNAMDRLNESMRGEIVIGILNESTL